MVQTLKKNTTYRFYKNIQEFLNVYYPLVMIGLIMALSIMANTLFSLGYVIVLSYMCFTIDAFLSIKRARLRIAPRLAKYFQPYMVIEITLILIY